MKDINKNIIALWFVSFFTDMASSILTPLIPILIVYILKDNISQLGYVLAITIFVSYLFRIIFWYFADKYRLTKLFLALWYWLSAITKPLFYFAGSWQSVAWLKSVERLWKAMRAASKDSVISRYSKKNKWWKNFWFHKMMDVAGEMTWAIIVFLILYFVWQTEHIIRNLFLFTAIPWVIATIIVIFFVEDAPYKTKKIDYKFDKADYKLFPVIWSYLAFLLFIFSDSFLLVQAKELWYSFFFLPLFIVLLYFVQFILSYYSWLKIDKIWSKKVLYISFIFGLLSQILLYFWFIWLTFICLWIFTILSINAIRVYIWENAVNKWTIYGILYAWIAIFSSLSALIVWFLWSNYWINTAIIFSIIWMFIVSIVSLFKINSKK